MSKFFSDKRQFILLTGLPGSGKTKLGNHLSEKHGFYFINTDDNPTELEKLCLGDIDNYVAQWLKIHDLMCVEWGFKPRFSSRVLRLKTQGASLFWLTCEKRIAHTNWLEDNKNKGFDPRCWDIQVLEIEKAKLPTLEFITIETYCDDKPIPIEELTKKIFAKLGD
jgi:energy-coupling factor transporter ATP-binding protein EcfA2